MSKYLYLLYGESLIENDNTLKDFAKSVCSGIGIFAENSNKENLKDDFINLVVETLEDDIIRTDIDYQELMCKYRFEIGDLLYEIENHGGEMPVVRFFGEEAKDSFNFLVKEYIEIHFDELVY